ncbi:hypothetical protein J3D45_001030 [Microbacterium foliorum]|uniref:hypothetical protein n=1 Tax=Microbacterium foliorum TaxID=104336 RepID=UPI00209E1AA7|nr:hypothetical protein [Microbacterium foliorum]MCP1428532.1 hypothetical protein [Microbacterium foliorum]
MGLDFVERFFKLTLDNVYRFACGLLFAMACIGYTQEDPPTAQLASVLNWLGVPTAWLTAVAEWIAQRQGPMAIVATLVLLVAVAFAAANDLRSRSGSTSLLACALLYQTGFGWWVAVGPLAALVFLALVTGGGRFVTSRLGFSSPDWPQHVWETVGHVVLAVALAALSVFSPLGWLISQEPFNARGTRGNPLVVEQLPSASGPSGAVIR